MALGVIKQADVDDLVVVGGASRIPWLRRSLRTHFPSPTQMHMTDAVVNAVRQPVGFTHLLGRREPVLARHRVSAVLLNPFATNTQS